METEVTRSFLPLAAFLLPLAGAVLTMPLRRISARVRDITLLALTALAASVAVWLAARVAGGAVYEIYILQLTPDIWMYLRVDALGALFGATVAVLWMLALVYSWGYMAEGHRLGRY
ncbi:MAG: hypothetical protein Q8M55_00755, partial [Actinomycetota bacterium]|nr:hypothetical protein [Actinomycetota bacterium]